MKQDVLTDLPDKDWNPSSTPRIGGRAAEAVPRPSSSACAKSIDSPASRAQAASGEPGCRRARLQRGGARRAHAACANCAATRRLLYENYRRDGAAKLDTIMELVAERPWMPARRRSCSRQFAQLPRPHRGQPGRTRASPYLHDHRARRPRRQRMQLVNEFNERRHARVPRLAQGRRHGPQPHGGVRRRPLRPLVERSRRENQATDRAHRIGQTARRLPC